MKNYVWKSLLGKEIVKTPFTVNVQTCTDKSKSILESLKATSKHKFSLSVLPYFKYYNFNIKNIVPSFFSIQF